MKDQLGLEGWKRQKPPIGLDGFERSEGDAQRIGMDHYAHADESTHVDGNWLLNVV